MRKYFSWFLIYVSKLGEFCSVNFQFWPRKVQNKMIGKLCIFSALLVSLVAGQDVALFLSKIKAERGFEDNPCAGRSGAHFAVNPRGCSWYFACTNDNTVDREDRCPTGLHFNYLEQTCDFKINVKCELDDRWNNLVCPSTRGVSIIPHPYSCSKYTGEPWTHDRFCNLIESRNWTQSLLLNPVFTEECYLIELPGLPQTQIFVNCNHA